ncbi:MAG: hypothetical protein K2X04_06055 [Burkholderiales bacterium]|nr:hypothetical protein [Burkholderiales bacterium]
MDYKNFTNQRLVNLIISGVADIRKVPLEVLEARDWCTLLTLKKKYFGLFYDFFNNSEIDDKKFANMVYNILDQKIELIDRLDTQVLHGYHISRLIAKNPDKATYFNLQTLSDIHWIYLLEKQPGMLMYCEYDYYIEQLAEDIPLESIDWSSCRRYLFNIFIKDRRFVTLKNMKLMPSGDILKILRINEAYLNYFDINSCQFSDNELIDLLLEMPKCFVKLEPVKMLNLLSNNIKFNMLWSWSSISEDCFWRFVGGLIKDANIVRNKLNNIALDEYFVGVEDSIHQVQQKKIMDNLEISPRLIEFLGDSYKNDKDVMYKVLTDDINMIIHIGHELKNNIISLVDSDIIK